MKRALISVFDKTGIVEFAKSLDSMGWEIISTGGTSKKLKEEGSKVQDISDLTKFPGCFDGRGKTLHPKVVFWRSVTTKSIGNRWQNWE